MTENEEATARRLVEELDRVVPRDAARVRVDDIDGDEGQWWLTGNRAGYCRFGIEFLRAALDSPPPGEGGRSHLEIDLDYLIPPGRRFVFVAFLRDENLETYAATPPAAGAWVAAAAGLGCLAFCALVVIGLITVLGWLWGLVA
jgi:hypothetical protein